MELNHETIDFIKQHAAADPKSLAFLANKYPEVDLPYAILQIAGRQAIMDKVPSWYSVEGIRYPRHLSLEQCSSEATAGYKSSLVQGKTLVDLTGGFGIDCAFLASRFEKVTYVERQKELCELANHNFSLLGLDHISVVNQEAENYLTDMDEVDCIFLDPARRNREGGKVVAISDCEPNVKELLPLLLKKAKTIMVKLSPMLDLSLSLRELSQTAGVHIISVGNECKELVLILKREEIAEPEINCINLYKIGKQEKFVFTRSLEQQVECRYTSEIKEYVYEPNASVLKAGAYKSIASFYELDKLHPNSHLYTSDRLITDFPGRVFRCESSFTFSKKDMKTGVGDVSKANIAIRNFPATVADLRKRMKLKEGGDMYLFATTLANEKKVVLRCKKVEEALL